MSAAATYPRKESKTMSEHKTIEIRHSDAAEQWATSTDRAVVFTVTKPNPERAEWESRGADRLGDEAPPPELRTDYTMPAKPNVGLALAYLKRARESADLAMSWLIEVAIGGDGYDALTDELTGIDNPDEAQKVLQQVTERIQRVAMGGLDKEGHQGPKA